MSKQKQVKETKYRQSKAGTLSVSHVINHCEKDIEIQPGFKPGSSEFQSDALTN